MLLVIGKFHYKLLTELTTCLACL